MSRQVPESTVRGLKPRAEMAVLDKRSLSGRPQVLRWYSMLPATVFPPYCALAGIYDIGNSAYG